LGKRLAWPCWGVQRKCLGIVSSVTPTAAGSTWC
jgi:hypothetical protein